MQFGRVFGSALFILGLILISLQAWSSLHAGYLRPEQLPAQNERRSDTGHLPGIVGSVLMAAGVVMVVVARRRDEPDPGHAVK